MEAILANCSPFLFGPSGIPELIGDGRIHSGTPHRQGDCQQYDRRYEEREHPSAYRDGREPKQSPDRGRRPDRELWRPLINS
jgi:hypothetical protein